MVILAGKTSRQLVIFSEDLLLQPRKLHIPDLENSSEVATDPEVKDHGNLTVKFLLLYGIIFPLIEG